jgi:hypothetical protein
MPARTKPALSEVEGSVRATRRKGARIAPRPDTVYTDHYFTINETVCECEAALLPSIAITVTVNVPGTVAGFRVTVAVPVLVESACEVAVTVTEEGRLAAIVGAV